MNTDPFLNVKKFIIEIVTNRADFIYYNPLAYRHLSCDELIMLWNVEYLTAPPPAIINFITRICQMKYKYVTKNNLEILWRNIKFTTSLCVEMKEKGIFNKALYDRNLLKEIMKYAPILRRR